MATLDVVVPREFTREEKLKAVAREISLRRNVYPGKVAAGKMKQSEADYQIAILIAIAKDYGGHGGEPK